MPDEPVTCNGDQKLAMKCQACGAKTVIVAGPALLTGRINDLEALIDELGTDPNPDGDAPEDVVKRHHAKAWEWARIANDCCQEVREQQEDRARLRAEIARLSADLELQGRLKERADQVVREQGAALRELRHANEVAEESITTLAARTPSYEDHRVLEGIGKLPLAALQWLSRNPSPDPSSADAIRVLVSLELSRRIARADLDLPYHVPTQRLLEMTHDQLFDDLEKATEAGESARKMTKEEREQRYRKHLAERGSA